MLTLMFRGKGFKFDHAITYIDDFIYNSTRAGGEPIDSQKIARAITQSILDVQSFGKKQVLRDQKEKKLGADLNFKNEVEPLTSEAIKSSPGLDPD